MEIVLQTINVVGARTVQIGDHNVAQTATQLPCDGDDDNDDDDNDDNEEDLEEEETKKSDMESSGEQKMMHGKQRLGFN